MGCVIEGTPDGQVGQSPHPEEDEAGDSGGHEFVVAKGAALLIALLAPLLDAHVWAPLGRGVLLAFPLQVLGGAVFFATRLWEPGPDRLVRAIWRTQIGALMLLGPLITAFNSWTLGHPAQPHMLVAWIVLGGLFALGLYLFEGLHKGALSSAQLDED